MASVGSSVLSGVMTTRVVAGMSVPMTERVVTDVESWANASAETISASLMLAEKPQPIPGKKQHMLFQPVEIQYTDPTTGESTMGPLSFLAGPARIPFEIKTKDDKGQDMMTPQVQISFDDAANPGKGLFKALDEWLLQYVIHTNPTNPNGGYYFNKNANDEVNYALADAIVRKTLWTSDKINPRTGEAYEPTASLRFWADSASSLMYDTDGVTHMEIFEALARNNHCVFTVKLDGIKYNEKSVSWGWTIVKGMVTQKAIPYDMPAPSYYAQFVTTAPKPAATTDAAPDAQTTSGLNASSSFGAAGFGATAFPVQNIPQSPAN